MTVATQEDLGLTAKQRAVLGELCSGASNKVIGTRLEMSEGTIKVHVKTIMAKMKVSSRTQAALKAAELGLGPSPWRDIKTAPRDGTLILLLIGCDDDRDKPLEDSAGPTRTIGFNNFDNDGEDVWKFAGWCWEHDHFTEGQGKPVKWAPLIGVSA